MQNYLVLLFAVLSISNAQIIYKGKCPRVQPVRNFDLKKYLGTWYESRKYLETSEFGKRCHSETFSLKSNGVIEVLDKAISNIIGVPQTRKSYAILKGDGTGQMKLVFPSENSESNSYILGTDYENWAAVFGCNELPGGLQHARSAFVFTKTRNPISQENLKAALGAFESQNLDTKSLRIINQGNCGNI